MIDAHSWIKSGARTFLKREFTTITYFIIAIIIALSILALLVFFSIRGQDSVKAIYKGFF